MFKSLNQQTGEEIIILDPKWIDYIKVLRDLDHKDLLVCQGCFQPVRVKAGKTKRWHFAHKHLSNCQYSHTSPKLLKARALLYDWLKTKFGDAVILEKQLENNGKNYLIDCWVQKGAIAFAYKIIENRIKPVDRENLKNVLEKIEVDVHWIFISDMIQADETEQDNLFLSTTEREFMKQSVFDEMYSQMHYTFGKSLHYVNIDTEELTSYRNLHLIHSPQLHKGQKITHSLNQVLVYPKTGEFVHPEEWGMRNRFESEKAEDKKLADAKAQLGRYGQSFEREKRKEQEVSTSDFSERGDQLRPFTFHQDTTEVDGRKNILNNSNKRKIGKCVLCGEITEDWWWYNGVTHECKCRKCFREGKA